jgi:multidrug transporter EmrE-like cation transporter
MNIPTRVVRLLLPSTRRGAVLAICAAAVFLVVETVLVILLKQVEPSSPVGVVYAVLTAMALLANFVVGVVAARKAVLALNASRARIVATGDAARRQVERDLHDGVQQRLVTSTLRLRLAEQFVPAELDDLKRHWPSWRPSWPRRQLNSENCHADSIRPFCRRAVSRRR